MAKENEEMIYQENEYDDFSEESPEESLDEYLEEEEGIPPIGLEIVSWEIDSHDRHQRSKAWYIGFALIMFGLIIYAVTTDNFLFALILIIFSFLFLINDARHPAKIPVSLTTEGILVESKFYEYDTIQDFSIVYKPHFNIRKVYFEFKGVTKHRLSLPLEDLNPLLVREELLKYLPEDLDRTDEPLSEVLAKIFKL